MHAGRGAERRRATPDVVQQALETPPEPLPEPERSELEGRLGQDFGQVRVHTGPVADNAAQAVDARAFTVGQDIVLAQDQYTPGTADGRRLLAHELAHVVQQTGHAGGPRGASGELVMGDPADAAEARADDLATTASRPAARAAGPGADPPAAQAMARLGDAARSVQGDFGAPRHRSGGLTGAAAVIPIAQFIRDVEDVERANPGDGPEETLSRIRVQWYGANSLSDIAAFDQLIPDAKAFDLVVTPPMGPASAGRSTVVPRDLGAVPAGSRDRLLARADENAVGDNPSPYLQLPSGERIDAGHLFLAADALRHPRTSSPYSNYAVPNIDPSSWVADVGIASVWMTRAEEGAPHPDAPRNPTPPAATDYFQMSAPEEDLRGDIDAFGLEQQWTAHPEPLSAVLRRFYLGGAAGGGATAPGSSTRFQVFCARNGLTFSRTGTGITWDPTWRGPLIARINRFNDLYNAGARGAARAMFTGGTTHRAWPRTPEMLDLFLAWLKPRLEAELARPAAGPTPGP